MNEKSTLSCALCQDLLPLYVDEVLSEESGQAVQEHLAHCGACREKAEQTKQPLPLKQKVLSTKELFQETMQHLRRRRLNKTILWSILIFSALIGLNALLTTIPLQKVDMQPEVVKVFRYEKDDQVKFMVLYKTPMYETTQHWVEIHQIKDGDYNLEFRYKTPLLARKMETDTLDMLFISDRYNTAGMPELENVRRLYCGEQLVWDANAAPAVPEYVTRIDEAESGLSGGRIEYDFDFGFIGVADADGKHIRRWDLEGNPLDKQ